MPVTMKSNAVTAENFMMFVAGAQGTMEIHLKVRPDRSLLLKIPVILLQHFIRWNYFLT